MQDLYQLSILICTYNRADILAECLQSLTLQTADPECFEVIVVNNNSPDHTQTLAESFIGKVPNLRVVLELEQGLCAARNRSYAEARSPWVLYLDDDAKASPEMVERALQTIAQYPDYKVFGGVALPWYKYGKPHWYKESYVATNQLPYRTVSPLRGNQFAIGCIMVLHKATLASFGGFDTKLGGMTADKIIYNDETELQNRMRKAGVLMAHDPALFVYHLVPPYKLNVDWFFKYAFFNGRDRVRGNTVNTHPLNLVLIALTALGMMGVHLVIYTPRLLSKNYYIENWLIDVFRKAAKRAGMIYTALLQSGSRFAKS